MKQDFKTTSWLASVRRTFTSLLRRKHYANTGTHGRARPKLEPIEKIVADAGRESATLAD